MTDIAAKTPITAPHRQAALLSEFWTISARTAARCRPSFFVFVVLVALFADVVAPHSPTGTVSRRLPAAAVLAGGRQLRFILGTDAVGRDMLSRLIYGSRYSLFIGVVVVTLALVLGVTSACWRASSGGASTPSSCGSWTSSCPSPACCWRWCWSRMLGPSLFNAMIAIAVVQQPHYVRLTRAAVMAEMTRDYVTAARVAGVGKLRLMFVTILPNCMAPLIVQAALSFPRHPRCRGAGLPRHGRAAADAGMGHHAGGGARIHPARLVGGDLARARHPGHRARHQPDGRRPARRARSEAEAELTMACSRSRTSPSTSDLRRVPAPSTTCR
jgi:dipeptide transport system permease protein